MKQKTSKKILIAIFMVVFAIMLSNVNVYATDTSFSLDAESVNVVLNGEKYISHTGGSGIVSWSSSDNSIATVDELGYVKGIKIGETIITATKGEETDTCKVNVIYNTITIGGNLGKNVSSVNLVMDEHETETLYAKVEDANYAEVNDAKVTWKSSNPSVVTVDENTGIIKAIKEGEATITATSVGVTDTCKVTVYSAPKFTDFSKAKYENELNYNDENLKISGITPDEDGIYYYVVTATKTKPTLQLNNYGAIDLQAEGQNFDTLTINTKENYIYTRKMAEYTELNKDLYLWVIQQVHLENSYYDSNSNCKSSATRFVVEGEKLTRAKLPNLNIILQTFSIGKWASSESNQTYIRFNFPTNTEKRKFTLKIGKVTDNSILSKIQKNDYTGITELLSYAKKNKSVYSKELTTTSLAYYRNDKALFDGNKLLENKAYYYIYVQFNDENGKYVPIEGVTLGQAWLSTISDNWDLWAFTSDGFKWDNLTPTVSDTETKEEIKEENKEKEEKEEKDDTVADVKLPDTGKQIIISAIITLLSLAGVLCYKKYNKYKEI